MSDRVLTAHISRQLAEKVDELAATMDRPRGWIMKEALELYVDLERKRHALTLEALADVDAGHTVDHSEIAAWAATLSGRPPTRRKR